MSTTATTHHQLTIRSTVTLTNGVEMPLFGLGCYEVPVDDVKNVLISALDCGYISIDTASVYKNEEAIGIVLRELFSTGALKREDLFITTKASSSEQGYDKAMEACANSLKRLGLDYVDLYLVHWPGVAGNQPTDPLNSTTRAETWRAFETLYEQKKCRSIGVSNYTIAHLEELFKQCKVRPMVNQVEFHPFLYNKELMDFCQSNGVALEAYASLVRTKQDSLQDKVLVEIATKLQKTPAQVLLRWAIQKNVIVIPKSVKTERIQENANIFGFVVPDEDMTTLDNLNCNRRVCWDPYTIL
ncbi:hypothetical protein SAMD00019534_106080 [Acytostelium subglobosum LB1]|uniref:hypothetical protein n=1 Tax=Acytostelium subglobosum LB1 TaxID=1410327 RepID=UPI0006450B24|nr:hypothetical protein SAMD00019534_106080 [Acytostelium subglobosum LB1]GAM27432.1 hypothetical protein SAMD00019534_106080 [Acytostelium subglobosum LB1]|eukprot:XP_012749497.1 hypothetical protein SAMD00019534_106080 [Acytostelium subglobosum LB1]